MKRYRFLALTLSLLLLVMVLALSGCFLFKPAAPSNLTATTLSASSIELSWSGNGDSFIIYRSVGNSRSFKEIKEVKSTSYLDTNLSANTTYFYEVKSKNKMGISAPSNIASAMTRPLAPILKITYTYTSMVTLSWSGSMNVEGYKLYRSTDSTTFTQIATITGKTSYTNENLKSNTKYYYKMKAYNKGGDSKYSNVVNTTTMPVSYTVSGYVKDTNGKGISGVTISFKNTFKTFSSVTSDSNGYWIKNGLSGEVTVSPSKNGWTFNPPSTVVSNTKNNVNFTGTQKPTLPSNPSPPSFSINVMVTPTLSWKCSGSDLKYDVYLGTSSNPTLVASNLTSNEYKPKTLSYSTKYYWKVVAKNSVGTVSGPVWNFKTENMPIPKAPTELQVDSYSTSTVELSWKDNSNNEKGFEIYRKTKSSSFTKIATLPKDTTKYEDKALTSGMTFYYEVKAYNEGGESSPSNVVEVTTKS